MFQKVKGTVDFHPDDKALQQAVFDRWKAVCRRYGFGFMEPPALENISLLTKKSGEEVRSQIFTLEKRSTEELGLRFEFTASFARMFIERQKSLPKPVKWFAVDRAWRYEQPQAGRLREFYQLNAEVYGCDKPAADAEVINLAVDCLKELGLTDKDFFVKVNNRQLLQGLLREFVPADRMDDALRIIDKRQKITKKEFEEELGFLGKGNVDSVLELLDADFGTLALRKMNDDALAGYEILKQVLSMTDQKIVRPDLGTARGLAYYTGTVFEIFDIKGKFRALCGGGRYDDMIESFGGQQTAATGFGMGFSTVSLLLQEKGLLQDKAPGPEYFVVSVTDDVRMDAMALVGSMRKKHIVAYDLNGRNLSNQVKYAAAIGAEKVIFFGPDEVKSGVVRVKDMKTGVEERVAIAKLS